MSDEPEVTEGEGTDAQPAERKRTSWSLWGLGIGAGVFVVGLGAALIFSSPGHSSGSGANPSVSASPTDPVEQCVATVMDLAAQAVQAVRNGYKDGLDITSVMTQYGSNSTIFLVFTQVNPAVLDNIYSQGVDNGLAGIQARTQMDCEQMLVPQSAPPPAPSGSAGPPAFNYSPPPGT